MVIVYSQYHGGSYLASDWLTSDCYPLGGKLLLVTFSCYDISCEHLHITRNITTDYSSGVIIWCCCCLVVVVLVVVQQSLSNLYLLVLVSFS